MGNETSHDQELNDSDFEELIQDYKTNKANPEARDQISEGENPINAYTNQNPQKEKPKDQFRMMILAPIGGRTSIITKENPYYDILMKQYNPEYAAGKTVNVTMAPNLFQRMLLQQRGLLMGDMVETTTEFMEQLGAPLLLRHRTNPFTKLLNDVHEELNNHWERALEAVHDMSCCDSGDSIVHPKQERRDQKTKQRKEKKLNKRNIRCQNKRQAKYKAPGRFGAARWGGR